MIVLDWSFFKRVSVVAVTVNDLRSRVSVVSTLGVVNFSRVSICWVSVVTVIVDDLRSRVSVVTVIVDDLRSRVSVVIVLG